MSLIVLNQTLKGQDRIIVTDSWIFGCWVVGFLFGFLCFVLVGGFLLVFGLLLVFLLLVWFWWFFFCLEGGAIFVPVNDF